MPTSYREIVFLPVGYEDPASGKTEKEVELRAITGADELYVGMSPEYNRHQNDLVFKAMLLSRAIVRIGDRTAINIGDIQRMHAQDLRVLEETVFRLTYGTDVISKVRCPDCGRIFEAEIGGPSG
ncbi:MAG: hypothetical protein ACKO6N_11330 [Myxococcota bacterium]